jgi:hypothetical protein
MTIAPRKNNKKTDINLSAVFDEVLFKIGG